MIGGSLGRIARGRFLAPVLMASLLGVAACGERETAPPVVPPPEAAPAADEAPIATTRHGPVRGQIESGILTFKGIRYGADTAATRFQPPRPPEPWTEVRDALAFGASARQIPTGTGGGLFVSWVPDPVPPMSEDCLFLNVWTPALRDGGKRPVLVWFHGGGFSSGSGSSRAYDGVRLAQRGDVVVVTVNHRLNVFGHLYLAEYGEPFADSGNAGILDLVASLEWVRDNIEEFGGDPGNVLIFGESGGGAKVSVLMAMDAARGLFHRAVIQSGPRLTNVAADAAAAGARAVVDALGLDESTIAQILVMPPEDIEQAARGVVAAGGTPTWAGPVFDGRNFTREPFEPDAPPQSKEVPLLIGTTRTEMSLLAGAANPALFDLTWETLPEALARAQPAVDAERVIAGYRKLDPSLEAPELYFTVTTDAGFLRNSVRLADRKADHGGAPVYFYLFDWNTPVDGGKWKSPHALEIGFVFDNVAYSESMSGIGPDQQRIADMMSEAWIAFARTGSPDNDFLPRWTPYTTASRSTMLIDLEPRVVNHPRGPYLKLLDAREVVAR
jgi:para-nitrobenzyl esterase